MIHTTLSALVEAEPALMRVLSVKFDKEGGAKLRYHMVKLARLVAGETQHFYETRNMLVEQHGDGEPKTVSPASPGFVAFMAAVNELGRVPIDIPWNPLTDVMLEPYLEITGADLFSLGPLFTLTEQDQ